MHWKKMEKKQLIEHRLEKVIDQGAGLDEF